MNPRTFANYLAGGLVLMLTVGCAARATATSTPASTPIAPTATSLPPTATLPPPSATLSPPTVAPTATSLPPTATLPPPTSTPSPPSATPGEEQYEQVNPDELPIDFMASIGYFEMGAGGDVVGVDGSVTRFAVGGKPIALSNDEIVLEGKEAFVLTKDYGKVKLTFNGFGIDIWLKPSQKAKLKELL